MSADATTLPAPAETAPAAAAPTPESWPVLSLNERRVLGVLVEKAKTTPDVYPLSLNSLITGCNQKSNRDPVLHLSDADVEAAIGELKKKGLVQQIMGSGRTDKFRHVLYEAWRVDKVELAVLAELLLRGQQTEGELRGRAARMEPIADLDALRPVLKGLSQRGLVIYLTPEGRRGTTVTHGFHAPDKLERLRAQAERGEAEAAAAAVAAAPVEAPPRILSADGELSRRVETLENELAALKATLQELQTALARLAAPTSA